MINYPEVMTEDKTIDFCLAGGSLGRYGDGEIKICDGASIKSQEFDACLRARLRSILVDYRPEFLAAIPNIRDLSLLVEQKRAFWQQYQGRTAHYSMVKCYGSSFITRPDSAPHINNEAYYQKVMRLWAGREVVIVGGRNKPFLKDPGIIESAKTVHFIETPSQNAYSDYETILSKCLDRPEQLFILNCGPTATVLAFDLCRAGRHAVDLGHFGMFYARFKRDRI